MLFLYEWSFVPQILRYERSEIAGGEQLFLFTTFNRVKSMIKEARFN